MKDYEWFALGLIPFAGLPVHLIRYHKEGHVPSGSQLVAGAAASQGLAYGMQRATGMKVADHLAYYRLRSLGFQLSAKQMASPTGPIWKMPVAARLSLPLFAAGVVGLLANEARTDTPGYGDRHQAHRGIYQPDFDSYV